MKPYQAYQRKAAASLPRIEMLLQLFDGTILLIERALELLRQRDAVAARPHLLHARAIVAGLGHSVDLSYGELPKNFARLYEFVQHSLSAGGIENVEAARKVLSILREGLEAIRLEALEKERAGEIPPLDAERSLMTMA